MLFILALALLASCASPKSPAAQAVEDHLTALVKRDEVRLTVLTCADWVTDALLEYDAFANVKPTLKDLDCQRTGSDGEAALVTCQGSIEANYGNEITSFDLGERTYTVVPQGGEWLVCGYSR